MLLHKSCVSNPLCSTNSEQCISTDWKQEEEQEQHFKNLDCSNEPKWGGSCVGSWTRGAGLPSADAD